MSGCHDDLLRIDGFLALKECKAVVAVITNEYSTSIRCLREFYYAKSEKKIMMILKDFEESKLRHETAGEWLILQYQEKKSYDDGKVLVNELRLSKEVGRKSLCDKTEQFHEIDFQFAKYIL